MVFWPQTSQNAETRFCKFDNHRHIFLCFEAATYTQSIAVLYQCNIQISFFRIKKWHLSNKIALDIYLLTVVRYLSGWCGSGGSAMFRLSVLFVFLSAVPALAEFNYRQFQKYETQSPQFSSAALRGYLQGIYWANFMLSEQTGVQLYCQPTHLTVNIENLRGGMRLHVENDPELETAPLGKVVLAGLQLLFPCE